MTIEQTAGLLGLDVVRHRCICPFHDDHHPSLSFRNASGRWRCWSCGAEGDAIDLVRRLKDFSFVQARRWLGEMDGAVPCRMGRRTDDGDDADEAQQDEVAFHADVELMNVVTMRAGLSAEARRFLFVERRYTEAAVSELRIGSITDGGAFADYVVSRFGLQRALGSGVVRSDGKGGAVCAFPTPCLLFPYTDSDRRVVGLQSRYLGRGDAPRFTFLRGMRPCAFNLQAIGGLGVGSDLWIAEGVTDCIALTSMGRKAIAVPSATIMNRRLIGCLDRFRLHMMPDNDEPGEGLFGRMLKLTERLHIPLERHSLPDGCKDVSEAYVKCGVRF